VVDAKGEGGGIVMPDFTFMSAIFSLKSKRKGIHFAEPGGRVGVGRQSGASSFSGFRKASFMAALVGEEFVESCRDGGNGSGFGHLHRVGLSLMYLGLIFRGWVLGVDTLGNMVFWQSVLL